jgi:hypothetical protein
MTGTIYQEPSGMRKEELSSRDAPAGEIQTMIQGRVNHPVSSQKRR